MTMRLKLYTLLCISFLLIRTACNQDDDPVGSNCYDAGSISIRQAVFRLMATGRYKGQHYYQS